MCSFLSSQIEIDVDFHNNSWRPNESHNEIPERKQDLYDEGDIEAGATISSQKTLVNLKNSRQVTLFMFLIFIIMI